MLRNVYIVWRCLLVVHCSGFLSHGIVCVFNLRFCPRLKVQANPYFGIDKSINKTYTLFCARFDRGHLRDNGIAGQTCRTAAITTRISPDACCAGRNIFCWYYAGGEEDSRLDSVRPSPERDTTQLYQRCWPLNHIRLSDATCASNCSRHMQHCMRCIDPA